MDSQYYEVELSDGSMLLVRADHDGTPVILMDDVPSNHTPFSEDRPPSGSSVQKRVPTRQRPSDQYVADELTTEDF